MSRLHRQEGIIGREMTEEEVAEVKAAGDTAEFVNVDGEWTKRDNIAWARPNSAMTYRIWSPPKPVRVDLTAEDILARSDMRIRKPDWPEGHFHLICRTGSDSVLFCSRSRVSYTTLRKDGWVWASDGTPCSKEAS